MKSLRLRLLFLIAIVTAQFALTTPSMASGLRYLNHSAASFASIPAPPSAGGAAAAADLAAVLAYQEKRSAAECTRADHERPLDITDVFGAPYGPLTSQEIYQTRAIYLQVRTDVDAFVNMIKIHWNRKRPYLESTLIKPCVPMEPSSSYPSGHATISRVEALVLGEIFPAKARALLARSAEVGLDRVLGGVHHPLDIQAGQTLGDILFAQMQQSAIFYSDLKNAR